MFTVVRLARSAEVGGLRDAITPAAVVSALALWRRSLDAEPAMSASG